MKTMKKTTAAIALAATAGLVAGPMVGMSQAWAAETGSFTINSAEENATITYGAVQIFTADVVAGEDGDKVSNIEWASDDVKAAVIACLPTTGDNAYTGTTAQEAAEYIGKNLGNTGKGAVLANNDLGMAIADALKGMTTEAITPGKAATLDAGYWLVIPGTDGAGEGAAASSPVYAVIGGDAVSVTEKTSVPTISKEIKEDSTGEFGKDADHTLGQDVEYRLTGTISSNFASFETYEYQFIDTFGAGLDYVADSAKIMVGDKDITDKFKINFANQQLTAYCANLVGVDGVDKDSKIVMTYTAKQNGTTAAIDGIENSAYIEYSHNPLTNDKSSTKEDKAKDYSYALKVVKTDNATGETLAGAKFTVQAKGGKYIGMVEGKLAEVDEAYEFETGTDGLITLSGLDADTYVITETQAPANYQKLAAPFEVKIDASDRTAVANSITEGDTTKVSMSESNVTVKNVKDLGLPVTGEQLGLIITLVGVGAVVVSGVGVAVNRKRNASIED